MKEVPVMTGMHRRCALAAVALVVVSACGDSDDEAAPAPARSTTEAAGLAEIQEVGIQNTAMPLSNVVTSEQPTPEQLSALVDLELRNFISLRASTEEGAGWEEGIAADAGIQFVRMPVDDADGLTRENVAELDRHLREAGEEGTVVYNGNRAGALLALRAYWLEGADPREALELGRRAGLSGLEPAVSELLATPR
jgi:protein tyrosine phosphatase (PTP) superfamily phosphohydrolase (DUF442 family)